MKNSAWAVWGPLRLGVMPKFNYFGGTRPSPCLKNLRRQHLENQESYGY